MTILQLFHWYKDHSHGVPDIENERHERTSTKYALPKRAAVVVKGAATRAIRVRLTQAYGIHLFLVLPCLQHCQGIVFEVQGTESSMP